jgi:hypothetical protein
MAAHLDERLFSASDKGRLQDVQTLLRQGARPDAYRDRVCVDWYCPLPIACSWVSGASSAHTYKSKNEEWVICFAMPYDLT